MGEKMKDLERRSYNFEIRAEESERGHIITGRPIVYNSRTNLGLFDEVIDEGALNQTNLNDVRFLVNHDTSRVPLARSRRNNDRSTMHFTVDSLGLNLDWVDLDVDNNSDARALYSAVNRGDLSGMSFAFSVDGESWDDLESEHPTRHITKIGSVVEVSAVTFPAYEATNIDARSRALDNARAALDKAKTVDTELALLKEKTKVLGGL